MQYGDLNYVFRIKLQEKLIVFQQHSMYGEMLEKSNNERHETWPTGKSIRLFAVTV